MPPAPQSSNPYIGTATRGAATGFFTIAEFLEAYPMARSSLYRLVRAKQLRLTKFGRASRIAKVDALAWAARLPTIGAGGRDAE